MRKNYGLGIFGEAATEWRQVHSFTWKKYPILTGAKVKRGYRVYKGPERYFYIKDEKTGEIAVKGLTGLKSGPLFQAGHSFEKLDSFWNKYTLLIGAKIKRGYALHKGPGAYFYISEKGPDKIVAKGLTGKKGGPYFLAGRAASVAPPIPANSPAERALPKWKLAISGVGGMNQAILAGAGIIVLLGIIIAIKK